MNAEAISADAFSELHAEGTSYQICLPHADTDYIQGKIKNDRTPYELTMLRDMSGRVQPGDLVLDIGANVGNHALYMATVRGCKVVAFEPNVDLCQALRLSADVNGTDDRLRIESYALGEVRGNGRFAQQRSDNLGAQAVEVGGGDIDIIPLDSLQFEQLVKLIKIDVEGMEMAVLRGGASLLAHDRPLVYVECLDESEFRAVSEFLSQLNYGYWDTFNASPTHLFIPNEQVNVDQRLSRLQSLVEEGNYRNGYQLRQRRKDLDEANRKYRFATEQIVQFKTQVAELTAEKKLLEAKLSALKERFDAASLRHRDADEQMAALKQVLEEKLEALSAARAKLVQVQSENALQGDRLAQKAHELAIKEALAEQAQTHANRQIEDLRLRERETRERCGADLARKDNEVESRLLQSEKANAELRTVTQDLREERSRLMVRAAELSAVLSAQETTYLATASALESRLWEAERESAELRIQISALREERACLIARADELSAGYLAQDVGYREKVAALESSLQELEGECAELRLQVSALCEERAHLTTRIDELSGELATQEQAYRDAISALERDRRTLAEKAAFLEAKNTSRTGEITDLLDQGRARDDELSALRREQRDKDASFKSDLTALGGQIEALKSQVSEVEAQRVTLNSELAIASAQNRSAAAALEQAKVDAVRSKLAVTEANAQIERLRQQLVVANQQIVRTKNTLSFQLGHALIFATKSFAHFRALPGTLWRIHRLANQRRAEKELWSPTRALKAISVNAHIPNLLGDKEHRDAARLIADRARERLKDLHCNDGEQFVRRLKTLKIASIMDEFTQSSYEPECNLLQLTPAHWQSELEAFQPEMLFIESAWRGKDALWGSKVGHMSQEIIGIVQWCREREVPTVFWNKEDPVHFETFLSTAKLFDFIFTTDIDCIHRYKAALGHERVYLLPFAAQPRINNPIERFERKDAFCFAGAYYARYPERTRDLGNFIVNLPEFRPLEIYDRNYGKDDAKYRFPDEYQPFIVGNLPYTEIDKAYKGYRYAINLNSVKQSQSMFARRVYELLASNTITVSNYSRGIRLMFGDLVLTSDSGVEITRRLRELDADKSGVRKLRLAALRKVMTEHTYQDRLAYIVAKVSDEAQPWLLPSILVTGYAKDQIQADRLFAAFARQQYSHKTLILLVPSGFSPADVPDDDSVRVLSAAEADTVPLASIGPASTWLSVFVPDDYYGEHYLTDLAVATRYSDAPVVGKQAHFVWSATNGLMLKGAERAYTLVNAVPVRAGMARLDRFSSTTLREWVRGLYTAQFEAVGAVSIDEFNYCRAGAALDESSLMPVRDIVGLDSGIAVADMVTRAESILPEQSASTSIPQLGGKELAALFSKAPANSRANVTEMGGCLQVDSVLGDGRHEYWYATHDQTPLALGVQNDKLRLHLETAPGLNLQLVVVFLDARRQKIAHAIKTANRNHEVEVPASTLSIRLGLRIYASGSARVQSLLLGHKSLEPAELFARARDLILTNHYPTYEDLYRNGFVHSRVRAYRRHGVRCDVFRFQPEQGASYDEFEDISITSGGAEVLGKLLSNGQYRSVLVHFLDEAMWSVLQHYSDRVNVVVWIHGAEIQPYHRREYNYTTDEARAAAKIQSDKRMAFWRGLLRQVPSNLRLIFVSRYFAEEVMEDLGFRLPERAYTVIHNPIDTGIFCYRKKDSQQRKKILSIRPYASQKYANDLSVQAILGLSSEPFFDELEFRMIGDGSLFDETLAPLRKFSNVIIERRFLSQIEIAAIHQEYGIFLCPTRMDAQGVSRDEAMASGLVPVTNGVAAIPEFVDHSCGVLAPAEDSAAMAKGIRALVEDEQLFLKMSASAAERVRRQSTHEVIVKREIEAFHF